MLFLSFFTDILFLSFLPILGIFIAKIPQQKEEVVEAVVETLPTPERSEPEYSWALSEKEISLLKDTPLTQKYTLTLDTDYLATLVIIFLALISPIAFFIVHTNPFAYLLGIAAFAIIYVWQRDKNLEHLHLKFANIFSLFPQMNKDLIFTNLKSLKAFILNQSKLKLIYTLLVADAFYLDLFIAKISLAKTAATAYILLSILIKVLIILGIYTLNKWLIEENIFKARTLDTRVVSIFFGISLVFLYFSFLFSKFFTKVLTLGMLTNFHTALPYILGSHLLITLLLTLVYLNNSNLAHKPELQNFILNFLASLHLVILLMLIFFSISSLEAVSFFISGLVLFLLTLFYHLFYRLHIYTQLV